MALVPSKVLTIFSLLILSNLATASFLQDFKLPWSPNYFKDGQKVELLLNTIESSQTQLPYSYYNLPFVCPPTHLSNAVHLSLGEVLKGDRIWQSDYQLEFGKDEPCRRLCDRIVSIPGTKRLDELIQQNYIVEWLIDGLPGSTTFITPKNYKEIASKYYIAGFPLGFVENGVSYIHNHVMIVVRWHKENGDNDKKTIVGFEVYPKSVSDYHCPGASKNFENFGIPRDPKDKLLIPFTYSVYWREDFDLSWYNRWDMFKNPTTAFGNDLKVHWISIINSLVIVSFLSLIVAIVFVRTLRSDFKNSNSELNKEIKNLVGDSSSTTSSSTTNNRNEASWKSIASEVFIQPPHPIWLSLLGGSGIQLCITFIGVIILLTSGISGPDNTILSTSIGLFVYAGFIAGFAGVQFFKNFTYDPSVSWRRVAFFSGSFLTGVVLLILLIMNFIIGARESSLALPFGTVMVLVSLYVLLEIPVALIGGYISNKFHIVQYWLNRLYKKKGIKAPPIVVKPPPTVSSTIESKSIPRQPFYNRSIFSLAIVGLFPFGILFVEIAFLFQSLWVEKLSSYYMYGFLSLTFILLVIVVVETSIIATYLRLNAGDFRWQWKSFIIGSLSIFFYLMAYTIYYLIAHLKLVSLVSVLLYLVYTSMMNILVSVACGSIALTSSTIFVYTIYSSTKKD